MIKSISKIISFLNLIIILLALGNNYYIMIKLIKYHSIIIINEMYYLFVEVFGDFCPALNDSLMIIDYEPFLMKLFIKIINKYNVNISNKSWQRKGPSSSA